MHDHTSTRIPKLIRNALYAQAVKERDGTSAELEALRAEFSKSITDRKGLQEDASKQKDSLGSEIHEVCARFFGCFVFSW
jgi:hypothetical protein